MNKAILCGNVGRDPEVRYTQGGSAVANLSIATTEKWTDKSGQRQEKTEWHRCVIWGRQAEVIQEYVKKGDKLLVEGSIETREWQGKDGGKRQTTEIKVRAFEMLGGRSSGGGGGSSGGRGGPNPSGDSRGGYSGGPCGNFDGDDIPF